MKCARLRGRRINLHIFFKVARFAIDLLEFNTLKRKRARCACRPVLVLFREQDVVGKVKGNKNCHINWIL